MSTKTKTKGTWRNPNVPAGHVRQTKPFVQWINGQRMFANVEGVHPVIVNGGFALPANFGRALGVQGATANLPHKGGGKTEVYPFETLHLAVLATRFTWFKRIGGQTVYLGRKYEEGARGRLQVMAFAREISTERPIVLTLAGMAGKAFSDTLKQFRSEVLGAAAAEAGQDFPDYYFWMAVAAGKPEEVGSNGNTSTITPPTFCWDAEALADPDTRADALDGLYAGDDVVSAAVETWDEAQAWAEEWNKRADGDAETVETPDDESEPVFDEAFTDGDEIPF